MKDLVIVGAGGMGREVLQWVKDINKVEQKWNIAGFITDVKDPFKDIPCSHPVIGTINEYIPKANDVFALAIGDPKGKKLVVEKLKARGAVFVPIIHPSTLISDFTEIGEGLVMYPGSGINPNVKVGNFVSLLSSGIGHDVEIGDYCTVSSYCDITGGAKLKEGAFIGSRVSVIPKRTVGEWAYVAAGSVVMTNIRPGYRVSGNPAMKMDF